jgi:hypothetical protein
MKRSLPVLVEHALAETRALQADLGAEFEGHIKREYVVSCKSGCANCCHHPFLITLPEGLLLYRWLVSHGHWTTSMRKRIEQTRDKTLGLDFRVWLLSNIPCPLLVDNKCSAYGARPLHCRATLSRGLPEMCHPHELRVDTQLVPSTEVIVGFNSRVRSMFKRLGVSGTLMPLSEAVLLGWAVDSGQIEIGESDLQHARDLYSA